MCDRGRWCVTLCARSSGSFHFLGHPAQGSLVLSHPVLGGPQENRRIADTVDVFHWNLRRRVFGVRHRRPTPSVARRCYFRRAVGGDLGWLRFRGWLRRFHGGLPTSSAGGSAAPRRARLDRRGAACLCVSRGFLGALSSCRRATGRRADNRRPLPLGGACRSPQDLLCPCSQHLPSTPSLNHQSSHLHYLAVRQFLCPV